MLRYIYLILIICFISCKKEKTLIKKKVEYDSIINLGSNFFQNGNYKEATISFQKAIGLNRKSPIAYYRLGVTYTALGDEQIKYADLAIKAFSKVDSIYPNYERIYYNLGICYMIKSNYEKAIINFEKAGLNEPNDSDIFYNKALSYLNLKDTVKACENFSKSKELGEKDADFLMKEYCID